jgi:hypothetical protein
MGKIGAVHGPISPDCTNLLDACARLHGDQLAAVLSTPAFPAAQGFLEAVAQRVHLLGEGERVSWALPAHAWASRFQVWRIIRNFRYTLPNDPPPRRRILGRAAVAFRTVGRGELEAVATEGALDLLAGRDRLDDPEQDPTFQARESDVRYDRQRRTHSVGPDLPL